MEEDEPRFQGSDEDEFVSLNDDFFEDAVDSLERIEKLKARVSALVKAGDDMADFLTAVRGHRKIAVIKRWDEVAINNQ